ncbi:hypothetical protein BpHYR1_036464 [Brachionus plicatilis]|uniref:Uncharacterized protein n=1 Tax=Brachionus plicatilis TaxID=10195 RepID=A0A3M7QT10_BRAPC|nr:hypothetical protein BpHYR1_036464 [Brachionus plicatilis]
MGSCFCLEFLTRDGRDLFIFSFSRASMNALRSSTIVFEISDLFTLWIRLETLLARLFLFKGLDTGQRLELNGGNNLSTETKSNSNVHYNKCYSLDYFCTSCWTLRTKDPFAEHKSHETTLDSHPYSHN